MIRSMQKDRVDGSRGQVNWVVREDPGATFGPYAEPVADRIQDLAELEEDLTGALWWLS